MTTEQREDIARRVVVLLERIEGGGAETVNLWTLNSEMRELGVTLSIKHPTAPEVPTVLAFRWIGHGALALAAEDCRGPASGHVRDPENEGRYIRCIEASDRAWDEAAAREYAPPSPEPDEVPL